MDVLAPDVVAVADGGGKARGAARRPIVGAERLAQALESAKAACRRLEEKAIEGAKATDRVIRNHPYPSIGVGFGIGLLIGLLVTRR